jgi:D-methionine transport system ATP-binding protein
MAVIEGGEIVETGPVEKFFLNPESNTAKRFIGILDRFNVKKLYQGGEGI